MTEDWNVELKDGAKVDVRQALAELTALTFEGENLAKTLRELMPIARGETNPATGAIRENFFTEQGELRPALKAILLNSVVQEGDSYKLKDPFAETEATQRRVKAAKQQQRAIDESFVDRLFSDLDDPQQGHSL